MDVSGGRDVLPLHLLGRGEAGRAERAAGAARKRRIAASEAVDETGKRIVREVGDAEVGEDVASVGRDQHVVRLEVAVDDAVRVEAGEGTAEVPPQRGDGTRRQTFRKGPQQFHREVGLAAKRSGRKCAHEVGMTERAQQAGLGAEALARLSGLDAGARTEELEREVLPGRLVVDAPDVTRRAAPN